MDRLGWTVGYRFRAFGAEIGVRSNDSAALDRSQQLLSADWKVLPPGPSDSLYSLYLGPPAACAGRRHYHLLYENELRRARTMEREQLFDTFRQALPWSVARLARGKLFLRAATLAWREKALILPGEEASGLVQALETGGARVYSRTYAVLDRRGRVHAYPGPGGHSQLTPLPVGLVLFARPRRGVRFAPRRLAPGQAALELARHVLPIYHWPTEVLKRLSSLALGVQAMKAGFAEAQAAADWLETRWR